MFLPQICAVQWCCLWALQAVCWQSAVTASIEKCQLVLIVFVLWFYVELLWLSWNVSYCLYLFMDCVCIYSLALTFFLCCCFFVIIEPVQTSYCVTDMNQLVLVIYPSRCQFFKSSHSRSSLIHILNRTEQKTTMLTKQARQWPQLSTAQSTVFFRSQESVTEPPNRHSAYQLGRCYNTEECGHISLGHSHKQKNKKTPPFWM